MSRVTHTYDMHRGTIPSAQLAQTPHPVTIVATADGVTSTWSVGSAYHAGTLSVYVQGIWQSSTEVDPANGWFNIAWTPVSGDKIAASWMSD